MSQPGLPGLDAIDATPRFGLFLALWPPETLRARIAAMAEQETGLRPHGGRMLGPHRYHLTLRWLGGFAGADVDGAIAAAGSAAARVRVPAFDLSLAMADGFASARVCWIGPDGPVQPLADLHSGLELALSRSGVPFERSNRLVPHVTVARDCRAPWPARPLTEALHWRVDRFVLVRSDHQDHSRYRLVGEWQLADPATPPVA